MKKIIPYINSLLTIILIYAIFYAGQGKLNPAKWDDTMFETFVFYVIAYIIAKGLIKFKI